MTKTEGKMEKFESICRKVTIIFFMEYNLDEEDIENWKQMMDSEKVGIKGFEGVHGVKEFYI